MNLKNLPKMIFDPSYRFDFIRSKGVFNNMPDREYLELLFRKTMGYSLNLDDPKTFNEKLQWLKLYDKKPEYTEMVDKYAAKDFFARIIGSQYIIPTIGVWDRFDDIDFDSLPTQFVLKTTHDSGGVVVCKDKSAFNINEARKKMYYCLGQNFFLRGREWPYKNVKPRIIAEEYLSAFDSIGLIEYKLFCFNGEPKLILVCKGTAHGSGRTNDFFDMEFNHLPLRVTYPNSDEAIEKPKEIDELLTIARRLSVGIPQVRVDTYVADGKVYIGEMTFFHDGGMCKFKPDTYDLEFGKYITLPEKTI